MITVPMDKAFIIYLMIWLITISILWVRKLWRDNAHDWNPNKSRLFRCDKCHYAFIHKESISISRCPRCNSICVFRKRRRF
ncbi:MAG: hypothetical protein JXR78_02235 [Victivallales bacterium]|nr:hypothetical protein [Victivallales bacterium]